MTAQAQPGEVLPRRRLSWIAVFACAVVWVTLLALGTWQMQRLAWKQALLAQIEARVTAPPAPLATIEAAASAGEGVDYRPVTVSGRFLNEGERHFLATHRGQSGFFVYTPLVLDDGRVLMVNRGFVPYDRKDPASRPQSQPRTPVVVTGLARDPLAAKPSWLVPENDPARNIFYWKDLKAMAASAGLPSGATVLPFFVDADETSNPGGLPVGGVTIVDLPNNHLQYAFTWYGLAAALTMLVIYRRFSR